MKYAILLTLGLAAPPAGALDLCDELWFQRNLEFHKAGYCFATALGQSVFGNFGCVSHNVDLSPPATEIVAGIKRIERQSSCKIDTSRTQISVYLPEMRKALTLQPIPDDTESSCGDWRGGPVALLNGPGADSSAIFTVQNGDTLLNQFKDFSDYSFVEVFRGDDAVAVGWIKAPFDDENCGFIAG